MELGFEEFWHKRREDGEDEALGGLIETDADVGAVGGESPKIFVHGPQHARHEGRVSPAFFFPITSFLLFLFVDEGRFLDLARLFVLFLLDLFPAG